MMRRYVSSYALTILVLSVYAGQVCAEDVKPSVNNTVLKMDGAKAKPVTTVKSDSISYEVFVGLGEKSEKFDWNIAGNGVNVLSELTWKDLSIVELVTGGSVLIKDKLPIPIYARASFAYGWITHGKNQDSDYAGNNRTGEYSRSNNNADGGDEHFVSVGVGSQFGFIQDKVTVSPLIGYAYLKQNFTMTDGYQSIPSSGGFAGLNSTYEALWYGPWAGLDLRVQPFKRVAFRGTVEYHFASRYEGEGNWNLRTDLAHPKSIEHTANGYGVIGKIGADFLINKHWITSIDLGYQSRQTDSGVDNRYFANGIKYSGKLNGANMEAMSTIFRVAYRF